MRSAIIGAGPIGSILGAHLAKNQQEIALVDILANHLAVIQKQGLTISGVTEIKTKVKTTCQSINELKPFNPEVIFVCVKTPVTKVLIPDLKKLSAQISNLTFVSFQNGLDAEQELVQTFGKDNTLRVMINYAGNLIDDGQVKMAFFNKPNYIGALSSKGETKAQEIARVMTDSGLDTEFTSDIKKYVWEKIILNSALSSLCAITAMTMKQAMDFENTYHIAEEILKEGIAVAKSIGYDYGPDFFSRCIKYLNNAGHHKTSMHMDIDAKRTTEINFLNYKIVEYGKTKGVPTPYNDTITCIIKAMEERTRNPIK